MSYGRLWILCNVPPANVVELIGYSHFRYAWVWVVAGSNPVARTEQSDETSSRLIRIGGFSFRGTYPRNPVNLQQLSHFRQPIVSANNALLRDLPFSVRIRAPLKD